MEHCLLGADSGAYLRCRVYRDVKSLFRPLCNSFPEFFRAVIRRIAGILPLVDSALGVVPDEAGSRLFRVADAEVDDVDALLLQGLDTFFDGGEGVCAKIFYSFGN